MRNLANPCYPMVVPPNNKDVKDLPDYLKNDNDNFNFFRKPLVQWDANSQSRVDHSLSSTQAYSPTHVESQEIGQEMAIMVKGPWTTKEDKRLIKLVERFGIKQWSLIAKSLNGRIGKQCKERWENHLRPDIKKEMWTEEEEKTLIEAHKEMGNKWKAISLKLPGRTENMVKNHFHSTKRLKIVKMKKSKPTNSKGTLLQEYVMEITTPKKESTDPVENMSTQIYDQENDEVNWNLHSNVPSTNGNDGYVPMMINADEISSELDMDDNTMHYEDAMEMGSLMSETMMKSEMEFMESIMGKP
ncbi:hypothetical protein RIF29_31421 [Crotalaria pallida]|uniref:Uncharacterized protein n=1 Tax=Crotalaria pallida TaxID=3830 RepID=A0AAN9HV96_CROPI